MTFAEYALRIEAWQIQELYQKKKLAISAYYNQAIQATTGGKNPKPLYRNIDEFFKGVGIDADEQAIYETYGDEYMLRKPTTDTEKANKIFRERMQQFEELKRRGLIDMNAWKNDKKGGRTWQKK